MKNFYLMPNIPKSGKCDQDFSFNTKEGCHALTSNVKGSAQSAMDSLDKLIKDKTPLIEIFRDGKTTSQLNIF
jgi:hypothetical protein